MRCFSFLVHIDAIVCFLPAVRTCSININLGSSYACFLCVCVCLWMLFVFSLLCWNFDLLFFQLSILLYIITYPKVSYFATHRRLNSITTSTYTYIKIKVRIFTHFLFHSYRRNDRREYIKSHLILWDDVLMDGLFFLCLWQSTGDAYLYTQRRDGRAEDERINLSSAMASTVFWLPQRLRVYTYI